MLQVGLTGLSGKKMSITIPDSFDYMILATVRAGTHWLASRLSSHPDLDNFGELGCKNYPEWMGMRKDSGGLHGFIAHYKDCSTANEDEALLEFYMLHLGRRPVIHLVRDPESSARSIVANAVVMNGLKEQGIDPADDYVSHHKGDEEKESVEVDPKLVAMMEEKNRLHQEAFRDLLLKNNPQHIEVRYEDMKKDAESTDLRILEFLGVKPMKLTSALVPTRRLVTVS